MIDTMRVLGRTVADNWRRLLLWGLAFLVLSQVFLLVALIVRFQDIPNYVTFYNWPANVAWIVQSTPAWSDMPAIIAEEWLIEIGYMNYDYGMGLSEWSLNVVPSRLVVMFGLGVMVCLATLLMRPESCETRLRASAGAGVGLGATLLAMTNFTMSWVVCCATPTWVVGLAMLGLGVSTSLALESLGPTLSLTGLGLLSAMIVVLAWRKARGAAAVSGEVRHA